MKKILLLIIVCLFVSGCSINYEVEIYNNKVNETIDLIDKSADSKESIKSKIGDLFQKYEVMYHKIASEIKNLRKKSKFSQEELAEKLG